MTDPKELRRFGFTIAGALLMIAAWKTFRVGATSAPAMIAGILSFVFFALGAIAPKLLQLPRRLWLSFGDKLGLINSRIILTVTFYLIITPIALLRRLFGARALELGFDRKLSSYAHPSRKRDASHMKAPF